MTARNVRPGVAPACVTRVRQRVADRPVDGVPLRMRARMYGMVPLLHGRESTRVHRSGLCAREAGAHTCTASGRAA